MMAITVCWSRFINKKVNKFSVVSGYACPTENKRFCPVGNLLENASKRKCSGAFFIIFHFGILDALRYHCDFISDLLVSTTDLSSYNSQISTVHFKNIKIVNLKIKIS